MRRKQLGDPLPQRAVDGAEQAVFGFVKLNSAHDALVFTPQGNDQRRAEFALRMQGTAVRHFISVGIHHFTRFNSAQGIGRGDRFARQMVVVAGTGKRQQLLAIGNRHGSDIQLFIQHLRHLHTVLLVESLPQDPFRRRRNF